MREIRRIALTLLSLALAATAPGATSAQETCAGDVGFDLVPLPRTGGLEEPGDHVIRSRRAWCALWDEIASSIRRAPPCPSEPDFRSEVVLLSDLGQGPNSCHSATIPCVERTERGRGIRVHVVRNVLRCPGCQRVVTDLVSAVVVDKPVGPVDFVHYGSFSECSLEARESALP